MLVGLETMRACVSIRSTTVYLYTLNSMFTINGDIVTVTTPSDCRWLMVEYQPLEAGACGDGDHREERRKVKVPATGNMVSTHPPTPVF